MCIIVIEVLMPLNQTSRIKCIKITLGPGSLVGKLKGLLPSSVYHIAVHKDTSKTKLQDSASANQQHVLVIPSCLHYRWQRRCIQQTLPLLSSFLAANNLLEFYSSCWLANCFEYAIRLLVSKMPLLSTHRTKLLQLL